MFFACLGFFFTHFGVRAYGVFCFCFCFLCLLDIKSFKTKSFRLLILHDRKMTDL